MRSCPGGRCVRRHRWVPGPAAASGRARADVHAASPWRVEGVRGTETGWACRRWRTEPRRRSGPRDTPGARRSSGRGRGVGARVSPGGARRAGGRVVCQARHRLASASVWAPRGGRQEASGWWEAVVVPPWPGSGVSPVGPWACRRRTGRRGPPSLRSPAGAWESSGETDVGAHVAGPAAACTGGWVAGHASATPVVGRGESVASACPWWDPTRHGVVPCATRLIASGACLRGRRGVAGRVGGWRGAGAPCLSRRRGTGGQRGVAAAGCPGGARPWRSPGGTRGRSGAEQRTGADANSLRSCLAAAIGAAHRERSAAHRSLSYYLHGYGDSGRKTYAPAVSRGA